MINLKISPQAKRVHLPEVVGKGYGTFWNFKGREVPTILIEMGFLSNPDEDACMETEEYRDKLAQGICNGIIDYFASVSDNQ